MQPPLEAKIQLWVELWLKWNYSLTVGNFTLISCMLVASHETFKTPNKPALDLPQQKSFSTASKRGYLRPKMKMTKKVQFWNLIMNIIDGDHKKSKIIEKFKLKEAAMTLKVQDFITVGSMYFWLSLPNDLCWGQIEFRQEMFWSRLIK